MFVKRIDKTIKGSPEKRTVYRLVESYLHRDSRLHRTIVQLGPLTELPRPEQKRHLGLRIEALITQHATAGRQLFDTQPDPVIEPFAQHFFKKIVEQQLLDVVPGKDFQLVDTESLENEDVREIGAEWLCLQALSQLNISSVLQACNWTDEEINLALTHIISRAVYPASELATGKWICQNSAVCELTGYPIEKITKDKLYGITNKLYEVKDKLEQHLSLRTSELFDLDDKIIIYDLTNTYFEGSVRKSKIAKFGRSKEKRSDARLIVLAVVVNTEGFLKYSQTFEGNLADSASLERIIDQMSERTSAPGRKPVVVLDAGIATEKNLELLSSRGYDYMCVSRSGMGKYEVDTTARPTVVKDAKGQEISLQRVLMPESADTWMRVHSPAKALKEQGMNGRFSQNFEQGLDQLKHSLAKKGGVKKRDLIHERIGRLKAKYASIHKHYEIEVKTDEKNKERASEIIWTRKPVASPNEGYYLLRTTLKEKDEETKWKIYNTIREIEATFRVLKTDLDLRPIYHKTDGAAQAHLHLGLLAYWIVNTVRHQLKQKGIKSQWKDIVRTMNTQKAVTTTMDDKYGRKLHIRQTSKPDAKASEIYTALRYKKNPFAKRKSVVPPEPEKKIATAAHKGLAPP